MAAKSGLGLARVPPRSERFRKIAPGLLVLAAYYESLVVVHRAMVADDWREMFGMWPIHALLLAFAAVLISRLSYPAR